MSNVRERVEDLMKFMRSLPEDRYEQKMNTLETIIMILVEAWEDVYGKVHPTRKKEKHIL